MFDGPDLNPTHRVFYAFFAKSNAQVVGIGGAVRFKLSPAEEEDARRSYTGEQFQAAHGPPTMGRRPILGRAARNSNCSG